ncbi:branched-chain amino acid ABC transporter substrate-binding protein [Mucilaginibacter phyllosphaerae]|nr:branched-chain amino acid ABC transporter substrate-binding protein [Mucilaginibacter phyllosphaerae]
MLLSATFIFQSCKKTKVAVVKTVDVRGLFSLTGNWSSLGLTSKAALEIAAEDINTYLAGKNQPFKLTVSFTDTKLDAELAKTQFAQAKAAGVHFIVGPQSSAELAALKPLVDASEIILVSQSSTAGSLAIAGDGIFRFCPSDKIEGAASANTIYKQGMRGLVAVSRNDAGNMGLQVSTSNAFVAKGGTASSIVYSTGITDYSLLIANIKSQVATLTATQGAGKVAVYLSSFDEGVQIFKLAAAEPALSGIKWYGGDGIVLSTAVTTDAAAADFAIKTGFFAPSVGLPTAFENQWKPVATRIKAKTGVEPDAFALAAYDALWAIAYTLEATNGDVTNYTKLKTTFVEQANKHQGISGSDALDSAGDRSSGTFDYFGIVKEGTAYVWKLVGKSDD